MALAKSQSTNSYVLLAAAKSFLVWAFILEVCLLVIGFPLLVLIVAAASIIAISLQPLLSMSAVLLVASVVVGLNLLVVFSGAGVLAVKGVNPQDVSWLSWLKADPNPLRQSIYASCPLTCDIHP